MKIGKGTKLCLFADDVILFIGDLKNYTRKLLKMINIFSKAAGSKITIQFSSFLNKPTKNSEKELMDILP